jgi:alginate O-acetyltransferase complex protein AlgI
MLFNSALYGVFLIGVYVAFWLVRARRIARVLLLVGTSYAFYFYGTYDAARDEAVPFGAFGWSLLCFAIIFVGSSLDFAIGKALAKTDSPHARRALLLASVIYYLGVLSIFKYFNFAADSISTLFAYLGFRISPIHLRLVLPFGISFFTFETMSYTIDVYRREIEPSKRYLDYLLFVCFFPHLVAGPIVRPNQMLPQLEKTPIFDADAQARGMWRIAQGLAKKVMIGDYLAQNFVSRVFENPERYSSFEVLIAIYGYAIQIYCDFSGYTDIALGSAQLFGYRLPPNFDMPYISRNLQEFWRRWHISLSTWLRDYLYVPLGGSRHGAWKTYRNLALTMVLGGLWHGASWNFVIWGALHGGALAATRMWQRRRSRSSKVEGESNAMSFERLVSIFFTFQFVCFAWIFFRAPTLTHAWLMITRMAHFTFGTVNLSREVALVLLAGFVSHYIPDSWIERMRERFVRSPALVQGVVLAIVAYAIHRVAGTKAEPFVYGQF